MENPLEKKRRTYLNFFKEGVIDAFKKDVIDNTKKSSDYYKQGYNFGLYVRNEVKNEVEVCQK